MKRNKILWEGDTAFSHYQIIDTVYDNRPARVLYSGDQQAAQSGIATDNEPDLLFDYNQRMLELVTNVVPKNLLLIGGGVGTLPKALLQILPELRIDVVELDSGLTDLAYTYFDLPVDDRLRIFHTDGRNYLRGSSERYEMILVDAFSHTSIPRELKTLEAFQAFDKHITTRGIFAMNIISAYHGPTSKIVHQICAAADQVFDRLDIFLASRGFSLWLPQNFVLVGQKGIDLSLKDYVRHASVQLPQVNPNDALHDET